MKLQEKKQLVLEYLYKAREEDEARERESHTPVLDKGSRSTMDVGVEALGADRKNASSRASPACKALVADVLVELHHWGWYRISSRGIYSLRRKKDRERQREILYGKLKRDGFTDGDVTK